MKKPLITRYRPEEWEEVIGQDAVVRALSKSIERRDSQVYLLHGPGGTGKTTLARIAAKAFGCSVANIREVDAATYSGIDNIRELQTLAQYSPFGESPGRAIIIDEAHGLSRQAWDSLLKILEDSPKHIIWFLCTTNPGKVPNTVKTRATSFQLKPVPEKLLLDLVDSVAEAEKIKLVDGVAEMIVKQANGSPRQALSNLSASRDAKTRKEAAELLKTAIESDPTIELCRYLTTNGSWAKAMAIVAKMPDENPEGVRIVVMNYMGSALKKAQSDKDAVFFLQRLEAFAEPYNSAEGMAPLLLSIGRVLFAGE